MKVIQYGCGKMAKYTMRYVLENGWDIVGAVDINPNVIGKDVGEIIGGENVGVKVVSVDEAEALFSEVKADVCIVTTMSLLADCRDALCYFLLIPALFHISLEYCSFQLVQLLLLCLYLLHVPYIFLVLVCIVLPLLHTLFLQLNLSFCQTKFVYHH